MHKIQHCAEAVDKTATLLTLFVAWNTFCQNCFAEKNETREDNVLVLSKFVTKQAYCLFAVFSFFSSEKRVILI